MTCINSSALVMHTAEQMFDLIDRVENYPDFLPWCSGTEVLERTEHELVATLHLSKAGFNYSFTTRNQLRRPEQMTLVLENGPFSSLSGVWDFKPLGDEACKVDFMMEFEFSGKIASLAMGKVFNQVASTMVDVFVKQADKLYGVS